MQDVPKETKRAGACEETRRVGSIQSWDSRLSVTKGLTIVESRSPIESASCVVSLAAQLLS